MSEDKVPPDMHIQHEDPTIFYCWKYWMPEGEFREGCTPIEPNEGWPDLNDYGYIYILVPLAALFLVIFLTCCICSKTEKKKTAQSKSLLIEDSMSESDDDIEMGVRAPMRSYSSPVHTVQAVPVRMSTTGKNDFYHQVQMVRQGQANKIPLEGGVVPMTAQQYQKQASRDPRIYPRLSKMMKKSGATNINAVKVNTNGKMVQPKPKNKPASTLASGNDYDNSVTSENAGKKNKQSRNKRNDVVEESETEEEYTEEEEAESEEENNRK